MKIIYTKYFPPGRYVAINMFGALFTKCRNLSNYVIMHESIHTEQMKELLYVGFYLWYVIEFLIRLAIVWNWHKAYRLISFEREAYDFETYSSYLNIRRHFRWLGYYWKIPRKD